MYFLTDHVDPGADVTYSNFGRRSRVRDHAYTRSRPAFHRHALARRYLNACVSAFDFTYVAMENPQIALACTWLRRHSCHVELMFDSALGPGG